jgi:hypothetical protein
VADAATRSVEDRGHNVRRADDKTVAKVRRELESRSDIPNVETRTDSKGRKQPSKKTERGKHPTTPPRNDASAKKRKARATSTKARKAHYTDAEAFTIEDHLEPSEYRKAFLLRAADTLAFAVYSGPVDAEVVAAAERAAARWIRWRRRSQRIVWRPHLPSLTICRSPNFSGERRMTLLERRQHDNR